MLVPRIEYNVSINADAVRLFLCDEHRGALSEEQPAFAELCKADIHATYRRTVFRLLLMEEMLHTELVDSSECFFHLLAHRASRCVNAPCFGVCAAVCDSASEGELYTPSSDGGSECEPFVGVPEQNEKTQKCVQNSRLK